jgi:serine/threonine protein phosphatase PrpC
LAQGLITPAQADASDSKNILTRAVGVGSTLDVDAAEPVLHNGDWILLCTDGLTKMVDEGDIVPVLNEGPDSLTVSKKLIDLALNRGGRDNVTVAVGRVTQSRSVGKMYESALRNWKSHRRQS